MYEYLHILPIYIHRQKIVWEFELRFFLYQPEKEENVKCLFMNFYERGSRGCKKMF
jgi:hypothetical protein